MLALDIETTYAVTKWIDLSRISSGLLLRGGVTGKRLNQAMDSGQISRVFKSLAIKAGNRTKTNQRPLDKHRRRTRLAR